MNLSRHNLSRAGTLFQGSAAYANYQGGKAGVETTYTYLYKPTGSALPLTFTAPLAVGATGGTLNAVFVPPTGFYNLTLSTGQVLLGYFIQGNTAATFWDPLPLAGGAPTVGNVIAAATASATIAGAPPLLGVATAYAASQAVTAGNNFVLNGSQVGTYVNAGNTFNPAGLPDVPRNVVGAWTTSSTVTVRGFDTYGQAMSEAQTGSTFTGKKAFAAITSITSSASITAATFGNGAVLGLPFVTLSGNWFGALLLDAADAGTLVQADLTNPATSATGDTRGTYTPAGALNGAKFLNAEVKVYDTGSQIGTFGMTPA
jgi:hypothetical protein